jgi:NAD(P)-dependent dehydrogenase (short-subunit alcohol dehydrogenase family)
MGKKGVHKDGQHSMATAILITGASRGLGFEFVSQYVADGRRVFAACRSPAAATTLQRLAQNTEGMLKDVTDAQSVREAATQLKDVAIDVLINSAGIAGASGQKTGNVDYESWAHVFNVNTTGPLRVLEFFSDHIARSGRRLVVTITSGMGSLADNTSGGSIAYRSSKAAVNMVMRSAASIWRRAALLVFWSTLDGSGPIWGPQGAVVAARKRDCHATAHRDARRKSIGQVL